MRSDEIIYQLREKQATRLFRQTCDGNPKESAFSPYVPIPFALIDNPEFRNGMMAKPRFRTYLFLRRRVVRGKLISDPFDVYKNYFLLGELAACIPLDKLSELLQLPKSTAADHIRQLERDKALVVDRIPAAGEWGQANVPIGSIQRILGHENRSTTEIYLHAVGDSERRALDILDENFERFSHTDSHTDKKGATDRNL